MANYIQQLKSLMDAKKFQDAKLMMVGSEGRPEDEQQAVIELLALAKGKDALELISFLLERTPSDHPFHTRLYQLATDRAHVNYAFAPVLLDHADEDQRRRIVPLLKHILSKETKGEKLNRLIRSLGKLKIAPLVDDVAEFIFYDDPVLKREAVKALERIGTAEALARLEQVAGTKKCDMDILDALDVLRDNLAASADTPEEPAPKPTSDPPDQTPASSVMEITAADLTAPGLKERAAAYDYFSDRGDQVAELLHENLDAPDPDRLINLLWLTARTIPRDALGDLLTLAEQKNLENPIKFSVYTALARFPEVESTAAILNGVTDASMYVRMAAVKLLDRHCSDYITAEIKKKIESGTKTGETLGVAIIDAKATRLIDALMDSDTFSYISSNYIERNAPVQAIDAYIEVLEKRGRKSTVKKYTRLRLDRTAPRTPWMAVIYPDPAALDIYAKLIHGCGFRAKTFEASYEAFEFIMAEKPAAIICDLFLRQLTVLDLAREIRELYPPEEVPIIASSLQRGLDPVRLKAQFKDAGINKFSPFPAKPSQIKSWAVDN